MTDNHTQNDRTVSIADQCDTILCRVHYHASKFTKRWSLRNTLHLSWAINAMFKCNDQLVLNNYPDVVQYGVNLEYIQELVNLVTVSGIDFNKISDKEMGKHFNDKMEERAISLSNKPKDIRQTVLDSFERGRQDATFDEVKALNDDLINKSPIARRDRLSFAYVVAYMSVQAYLDTGTGLPSPVKNIAPLVRVCLNDVFLNRYYVDCKGRAFSNEFLVFLYKTVATFHPVTPYAKFTQAVLEELDTTDIAPFEPLDEFQHSTFSTVLVHDLAMTARVRIGSVTSEIIFGTLSKALSKTPDIAERYYGKVTYYGTNKDFMSSLYDDIARYVDSSETIDIPKLIVAYEEAGLTLHGKQPLEDKNTSYKRKPKEEKSDGWDVVDMFVTLLSDNGGVVGKDTTVEPEDLLTRDEFARHVTDAAVNVMAEYTPPLYTLENAWDTVYDVCSNKRFIDCYYTPDANDRVYNDAFLAHICNVVWYNNRYLPDEEVIPNAIIAIEMMDLSLFMQHDETTQGDNPAADLPNEKENEDTAMLDTDVTDKILAVILDTVMVDLVKVKPDVRLPETMVEKTLSRAYKEVGERFTYEQYYQIARMLVSNNMEINGKINAYDVDAIHLADTTLQCLIDNELIKATHKQHKRLAYHTTYIVAHFFDETCHYIPEAQRDAYKNFVKRYLTIPHLFAGGYEYRSFNLKFGYITALFFLALDSHDFDTETEVGADSLALSLMNYWKLNSQLWSCECGITPRLELFEVRSMLHGVSVITIRGELKAEQHDSEGMVYTTCGIDETEYKTTVIQGEDE